MIFSLFVAWFDWMVALCASWVWSGISTGVSCFVFCTTVSVTSAAACVAGLAVATTISYPRNPIFGGDHRDLVPIQGALYAIGSTVVTLCVGMLMGVSTTWIAVCASVATFLLQFSF